jgi:hypothetical protein
MNLRVFKISSPLLCISPGFHMPGEWYAQLAATAAFSLTSCPADSWVDALFPGFSAVMGLAGRTELIN